jgi:hypothetical protein
MSTVLYGVDVPNASGAVTNARSIRVLVDSDDRPLWEMGDPTRIPLAIDREPWTGFTFWLTYAGVTGELTSIEIRREHDAKRLGAHLLQRVPLGALDRFARCWVEDWRDEWVALNPGAPVGWLDAVADTDPARDNDPLLAKLCRRYLEVCGEPGWRGTLSHEFPWAESSIQTVISRARKRGFLTKVAQGRAGGQLTPTARRLLADSRPKPDRGEVETFLFGEPGVTRAEILRAEIGHVLDDANKEATQ